MSHSQLSPLGSVKTKCVEEKNCLTRGNCKSDLKEFAVALREDKHVYVCEKESGYAASPEEVNKSWRLKLLLNKIATPPLALVQQLKRVL